WRNCEFIVSSDFGRKRVGEVLVGAHHVDAREVERLPGQVRQRLMRTYLCAPLAQDRLKLVECLVVCLERIQLRLRACGRLRGRRTQRDRPALCIRCERPPGCDRSECLDEVAPSHIHPLDQHARLPANSTLRRTSGSGAKRRKAMSAPMSTSLIG